jgi:hypothetical protein
MKKVTQAQLKMMGDMGGAMYAHQEAWDIQQAASALSFIAGMVMDEVDEPTDVQSLANIMRSLLEFISGEIADMVNAAKQGEGKSADTETITPAPEYTETSPAQVRTDEPETLNLSYVKALGLSKLPDLAVKFVAKDTIRHPVFLWGDPDLTDLEREYFTSPKSDKGTDFWDTVLGKSPRPLTWDHAQDPDFKADPLIGETVEWEDNEIGRFATSILKKNHKYRKAIDELIGKKMLGSAAIAAPILGASSDSAPQYVQRVPVGKSTWLARWPWFATALTPTPCEPRMIGPNGGAEFIKSLGITLPDMPSEAWEADLANLDFLKIKYFE